MKILVLNCGSSSIKYQLMDMSNTSIMSKGIVEKIGMKGSFMKHTKANGDKVKFEGEILDHASGLEYVLGVMTSQKHGCIKTLHDIDAAGHRVVHGGERFSDSAFIDQEVHDVIEKCIQLAPLHVPANLKGIDAMAQLIPGIRQVAVFDTSFHQTMPEYAFMYGIPYSLYKKYGIRRYGFHGMSHRFVSNKACESLGVSCKDVKIITCHLGNGASITAIRDGKSVDTSMGLTPAEGLMMGTRSGDLDLGILTFIMDKEEIDHHTANTLINKHSGVLGVSGISSDMREIEIAAWEHGNKRAQLALDMYHYRVIKYIGSYIAAMNGLDILVFTGGIGENGAETRRAICENLTFFGLDFDEQVNHNCRGQEVVISKPGSIITAMVVPTNEELVIANDTEMIINKMN